MFLWKMSTKSISQTDFLATLGSLSWWGKNAVLPEAICTYFHLVGTCVAKKISYSENAGITETPWKISPTSLQSQSSLNIKGAVKQSSSFTWCKYTVSLDRDYYFKYCNF